MNIHKETTELRKYYETLQIDLISQMDEVELPEINEKLSINNFNSYIEKLEKLFEAFSDEEKRNLSEQKRLTLSILKQAFQEYRIPPYTSYT